MKADLLHRKKVKDVCVVCMCVFLVLLRDDCTEPVTLKDQVGTYLKWNEKFYEVMLHGDAFVPRKLCISCKINR